jgi:hypothetical protein
MASSAGMRGPMPSDLHALGAAQLALRFAAAVNNNVA